MTTNGARSAKWSLILGASGAIGSACARALALAGHNIFGVHLDSSDRDEHVQNLAAELRTIGVDSEFANINAANEAAMKATVRQIATRTSEISAVVHALAFGSLLPFIRRHPGEEIVGPRQMQMTLSVMAHSLVFWVQELLDAGLLRAGGKIFALTSIGSTQAAANYGAVSAAKSALESHVRQLAFELAPDDIAVNAIRSGLIVTPALRRIPGSDELVSRAIRYNPHQRLTTCEEVAEAIALLTELSSAWMTGNVIGVDGGEILTT